LFLTACDRQSREDTIAARLQGADQLDEIAVKWKDAFKVASATGRVALSGPVGDLQSLKREVEALEVSECLRLPKLELSSGFDKFINMFLAHMRQEEPDELKVLSAMVDIGNYTKGAALCKMTPEEAAEEIQHREAEAADKAAIQQEMEHDTIYSQERIREIIRKNKAKNPVD
jgi:hypothetical protein